MEKEETGGQAAETNVYELTYDKAGVVHRYTFSRTKLLGVLGAAVLFILLLLLLYEQRLSVVEDQRAEAERLAQTLRGNLIAQASEAESLRRQLDELDQEKAALHTEAEEYRRQLEERQSEEEAAAVPSAYPIRGSAQLVLRETSEVEGAGGGDTQTEEDAEAIPSIGFQLSAGCRVVAAGSGIVASLTREEDGSVVIEIDHGNGYRSYYHGSGVLAVAEAETVAGGTVLLIPAGEDAELDYRISRDGRYIDPMEFMEVNG